MSLGSRCPAEVSVSVHLLLDATNEVSCYVTTYHNKGFERWDDRERRANSVLDREDTVVDLVTNSVQNVESFAAASFQPQ